MSKTSSCGEPQKKRSNDFTTSGYINPLSTGDRTRAVREEFTSVGRDCPYYNEAVRSRCLIDPHVIFMPECDGRSFSKGVCCPKIIQSSIDSR